MKKLAIILTILLSACSGTGPLYSPQDVPKNMARVVLYRESNFWNMGEAYWVEFNGNQVCDLHNGSYMTRDVNPGDLNIASSSFGSIGTSRIALSLKPKQIIFVKMEVNGQRVFSGVFGGVIGNAVDEGVSSNNGPVMLGTVNEVTAKSEMTSMHQDCM